MNKEKYTEPSSYFPESVRKNAKIGEFADEEKKKKEKEQESRELNQKFRDYVNKRD